MDSAPIIADPRRHTQIQHAQAGATPAKDPLMVLLPSCQCRLEADCCVKCRCALEWMHMVEWEEHAEALRISLTQTGPGGTRSVLQTQYGVAQTAARAAASDFDKASQSVWQTMIAMNPLAAADSSVGIETAKAVTNRIYMWRRHRLNRCLVPKQHGMQLNPIHREIVEAKAGFLNYQAVSYLIGPNDHAAMHDALQQLSMHHHTFEEYGNNVAFHDEKLGEDAKQTLVLIGERRVRQIVSGELIALKIVKSALVSGCSGTGSQKLLANEIKLHRSASQAPGGHCILPYFGAHLISTGMVIMELGFAASGDLYSCFIARGGQLGEGLAFHLYLVLQQALEHIHGLGIVHCDYKSANLFVGAQGQVYLGDFGIAIRPDNIHSIPNPHRFGGTVSHWHPEIGHNVDQWNRAPQQKKPEMPNWGAFVDYGGLGKVLMETLLGHVNTHFLWESIPKSAQGTMPEKRWQTEQVHDMADANDYWPFGVKKRLKELGHNNIVPLIDLCIRRRTIKNQFLEPLVLGHERAEALLEPYRKSDVYQRNDIELRKELLSIMGKPLPESRNPLYAPMPHAGPTSARSSEQS